MKVAGKHPYVIRTAALLSHVEINITTHCYFSYCLKMNIKLILIKLLFIYVDICVYVYMCVFVCVSCQ